MEHQRVAKPTHKEQPKTPSSSLRRTSLSQVAIHPLLELQRTIGNQAVLNLLHSQNTHMDASTLFSNGPRFSHDFSRIPIHSLQTAALQTKLQVNQPRDIYEQEADQVADQVMHMTDSERSPSDEKDKTKDSLMREQTNGSGTHGATDTYSAPPIAHEVLNSGEGQPLDATTRAFMEPRFGHDFSQVRIHADASATESTKSINANAYTVGQNVFFGSGQYTPESATGRRLLAHELTHVIQQGTGNLTVAQRQVISDSSTYTRKTDPNSIIPISNFLSYIEVVEKSYPQDTPEDILTRIRVQYYNGIAFEQLIPQAHTHDEISFVDPEFGRISSSTPRVLEERKIGADVYKHLTAHADENALGDNPSPYIQLSNGERVDVGHLLLGLDALLHPVTGSPYSDYGVPNIDPASWVADLGLASVWMTQHEQTGSPPADAPKKLSSPNLNAYYQMSAPNEDLLGDVDTFGVHKQWTMAPGQKLSQVLRAYYLGNLGAQAEVKSRWQTFCAKNGLIYTRSGNTITWSPAVKSSLIPRINAFNDLAGAGKAGAIWGSIYRPTKHSWPHTSQIIDMFLSWVKTHLEAELASPPQK